MNDEGLMIDANAFLSYLRMMGFGVASWAYSQEDLNNPSKIAEIEASIANLSDALKIDSDQAAGLVKMLVANSCALESAELEKINVVSRPHSLTHLLETINGKDT